MVNFGRKTLGMPTEYLKTTPTIADAIGFEMLEIEEERVTGRIPVDGRTHQPYGLLHGGASVVLAETLGSVGSHFLVANVNEFYFSNSLSSFFFKN